MLYADLNSFFEVDVSGALGKQRLIEAIAADLEAPGTTLEEEGNVYRLVIRFQDHHVEIWDAIMEALEDGQEPYTMTLEAFSKALEAYIPGTFPAQYKPESPTK